MYSNNGTNFVKANSELQRCLKQINQHIVNEQASVGVEWKHAAQPSSIQGSIYEVMIKLNLIINLIMADKELRTLTNDGPQILLKKIKHTLNCQPLL